MPSGTKRYNITALAYNRNGKLVSVGRNSYVKTHPLQAEYANKACCPQKIFLHAEIHALLRAREPVHKLVVLRYYENGKPAPAKPCPICQLAIKDFNVKEIVHT